VNDLIDTTEMYLRTIYDLEEEGITPLRARIAERLQQSGPTVSQTVARMERDGLVIVADDRHLRLTDHGRELAVAVMRKHRLAERLLVEVIGLGWEQAHIEACRWEHVMSEAVERKLVELLDHPLTSPYGNPIPGLDKLGEQFSSRATAETDLVSLDEFASAGGGAAEIRRIAEYLQADETLMSQLKNAGILPGRQVQVSEVRTGSTVEVTGELGSIRVPAGVLHAVLAKTALVAAR
jgi:DtxR family Mn-dependent transcriptional regulator